MHREIRFKNGRFYYDNNRDRIKTLEKENIILKSNLAYAMGKLDGLGYPSKRLNKLYPELADKKE